MACEDGICFVYSFIGRLVAYFTILALLVMISVLVIKCIGEWKDTSITEVTRGENIPLMQQFNSAKLGGVAINYGACHRDLESGNSSNGNYAEELYNSKFCVICYDEQRDCFFVPCGHRATCHLCARRIFCEENRHCPICRRFIGKIRRLVDS